MRILLGIAGPTLLQSLKRGLESASYAVDAAETCEAAGERAMSADYALIVLDPRLSEGRGLELLRAWRGERVHTPVLVLSDSDTLAGKIEAFDAGADDCLVRSFAWEEFLLRVRSLLTRCRNTERIEVLTCGDLALDRLRQQVRRGGKPLALTAREFALLEYLMLNAERVVSRLSIAEHVWDADFEARSNVIDVIIGRLRRKLEAGGHPRMIFTVTGVGYALRERRDQPTVETARQTRNRLTKASPTTIQYSLLRAILPADQRSSEAAG